MPSARSRCIPAGSVNHWRVISRPRPNRSRPWGPSWTSRRCTDGAGCGGNGQQQRSHGASPVKCGADSARRVRSASCRVMMRNSRSAFSFASSPITTRIVRACRSARSSNWSARLLSVVMMLAPARSAVPLFAACRGFISATTGFLFFLQ